MLTSRPRQPRYSLSLTSIKHLLVPDTALRAEQSWTEDPPSLEVRKETPKVIITRCCKCSYRDMNKKRRPLTPGEKGFLWEVMLGLTVEGWLRDKGGGWGGAGRGEKEKGTLCSKQERLSLPSGDRWPGTETQELAFNLRCCWASEAFQPSAWGFWTFLFYRRVSWITQLVKNPPAMQETPV